MFFKRLLSSIVLISLFLTAMLWESPAAGAIFGVLALLLAFFATREFLKMLEKIGRPSFSNLACNTAVLLMLVMFLGNHKADGISLTDILIIFTTIGWVMLIFGNNKPKHLESFLNSAAALVVVLLPLAMVVYIYNYTGKGNLISITADTPFPGRKLLLFLILVTKSGDIGAYVIGSLSNKILRGKNHKIVPTISPKKSWEGTIGGLLTSMLIAYILRDSLTLINLGGIIPCLILGMILFVGGFTGDLAESALKRTCEVKDSGATIPGIGGILDLLDSLFLNAPIFYFIILIAEKW